MAVGEQYKAVEIGRTPDGSWTIYAVMDPNVDGPHGNILGMVAEGPEQNKAWRDEPYRDYRSFSYEQNYGSGTFSFSSPTSLDQAVAWMRHRYQPDWTGER